MQKITDSVGEKGANKRSDAALVQAILVKTKREAVGKTPATSYLAKIDGDCGGKTKTAIQAFQTDHVFVSADGLQCVDNPRATAGLIKPDDATWEMLLKKVDPKFADMRVMDGGKTVYVAATDADLASSLSAVAGFTFVGTFRPKITATINRMFELYKITVGVCRDGDRRTFQTQYTILTSGRHATNAGPGESNHNFGMAADLGFEDLRWLKEDGKVVENETSWFHILNPDQNHIGPEAMKFWQALRAAGTRAEIGLFCGPESDRPHLQNWNDAGIDMANRLADLLTRKQLIDEVTENARK